MPLTDQRVDAYIAKSQPFAQPVLKHFRRLIHQACPEVEETIKWGFPNFQYRGILCSMAAFKEHCAFNFWKGALLEDKMGIFAAGESSSMGQLGKIKSLTDLPPDRILVAYIREAAKLNEGKIQKPSAPRTIVKKALEIPPDLASALKKDKNAARVFEAFSHTNKKEYVDWLTEAKTPATRDKRLATAITWIGEGKSRNWKYQKK